MLEGIPGPLVSSAKGTKGLSMTLTSWYVNCIHGALVSWFPLSLKGSQTHWNQGWKRPITPGHLVHPLTPDTTGFSVLCSPEGFVLSTSKCLKSRGFHPSTTPAGRPFHSSTHTHLHTFSWEHIQIFLHFTSSCDPPPENASAPSSVGMKIVYTYECLYMASSHPSLSKTLG